MDLTTDRLPHIFSTKVLYDKAMMKNLEEEAYELVMVNNTCLSVNDDIYDVRHARITWAWIEGVAFPQ
ncbi:hypothetical protein [Paenibacillus monticola]|uniref:hypothetical protein n=1 Tax=Paenibacillus monticola TaxID=2666075 RepID=UPI001E4734AD|nr:hypothetical protein [Paenibacillus monticola]